MTEREGVTKTERMRASDGARGNETESEREGNETESERECD